MFIYFIRIDKQSETYKLTQIVQPFCYRTMEKAQSALAKHLKVLTSAPDHHLLTLSENSFTIKVTTLIIPYTMTYSIDFLVTH